MGCSTSSPRDRIVDERLIPFQLWIGGFYVDVSFFGAIRHHRRRRRCVAFFAVFRHFDGSNGRDGSFFRKGRFADVLSLWKGNRRQSENVQTLRPRIAIVRFTSRVFVAPSSFLFSKGTPLGARSAGEDKISVHLQSLFGPRDSHSFCFFDAAVRVEAACRGEFGKSVIH